MGISLPTLNSQGGIQATKSRPRAETPQQPHNMATVSTLHTVRSTLHALHTNLELLHALHGQFTQLR